ncbi:hypothetical protein [Ralstonia phage GP4]|uniref:DUF6440 domain-containing protein n=1 Tax=Ralstonia phage GP4 TaxID=2282904 RepID=A0A345GTW2_9CAUD|nr:hypothetical protein KMC52_gp31 [Ralstonia phage GP4]AXG67726.1 hypothetical protein [Ralstonia phage GP4]
MFSKDINCYRKTARTMNEAFGPYSGLGAIPTRRASLGTWACYAVAVLSIVTAAVLLGGCGQEPRQLDTTDDARAGLRSDLVPYTDYGTGCQYLRASGFSGLTPRLDSDGRPMCGNASKTKAVTLVSAR